MNTSRTDRQQPPGYGSALDLPSYVELLQQIEGAKLLTRFVKRAERQKFLDMEREVRAIAATVDRFYELLGDRHWIYHDDLTLNKMTSLVTSGASIDELEHQLITNQYGNDEWLRFLVGRLHRFPVMRHRMRLIHKAVDDYQASRYYAATLVLISVMDGFVNDLDPANRRGLHTRDPSELVAWDSVVGHHKGLAAAHATFTKGFKGTSSEPVYELYRNGIIHGNLTNFDNVIVATKAWNRLFAVADWAKAREKELAPKQPQPSWGELFKLLAKNARTKKLIAAWQAQELTAEHPKFTEHPAYQAAATFFTAWQGRKYGVMVPALPWKTQQSYGRGAPGQVRSIYQRYALESAVIEKLDFSAPSVCVITVKLCLNGSEMITTTRWLHECTDSDDLVVEPDVGIWRLVWWEPEIFLKES